MGEKQKAAHVNVKMYYGTYFKTLGRVSPQEWMKEVHSGQVRQIALALHCKGRPHKALTSEAIEVMFFFSYIALAPRTKINSLKDHFYLLVYSQLCVSPEASVCCQCVPFTIPLPK